MALRGLFMQGQRVTPAPRLVRSRYRATAFVLFPWPALRVAFARLQPLRVLRFALDAPRTHPAPRGLPQKQKHARRWAAGAGIKPSCTLA